MIFPARTARPAASVRRACVVVLVALLWCAATVLASPAAPAAATPAQLRAQQWWISRLALPDAWKVSKGKGVTVAVVGTGVDTSVADLRGATVPGFSVDSQLRPTHAWDKTGHSTSMAVYIAGRGTGPGILGVAPEAKIMPVYLPFGDPPSVADALDKLSALAHPPPIVNMSFGTAGPCVSVLQTAVEKAVDKGMILVASAGNNGSTGNSDQFPSNCKGVVAVGAFDYYVKPWVDTQRQPYVSLGGPGVHMVAYDKDLHVGTTSGTSNGAAVVAGEMALVKAHFPKLTSRQIVARMFATASKSTYHGPRYGQTGDTLGYGAALPYQALTRSVPANAPNPVYDDLAKAGGTATSSAPSASGSATLPESSTPAPPSSTTVDFPGGSTSAAASGSGGSGSNIGVILGGVAAAVIVVALVAYFLVRRSRGAGTRPR